MIRRTNLHNHAKFCQNRTYLMEMLTFFYLHDGGPHHLELSKFKTFSTQGQCTSAYQMSRKSVIVCRVIEINSILNGCQPPSSLFKIWSFEQLVSSRGLCVIIQNCLKMGQTVLEISWFSDFQHGRHLF